MVIINPMKKPVQNESTVNGVKTLLGEFADDLQGRFSAATTGEPEYQLRGPLEQLLKQFGSVHGLDILLIGETRLPAGQQPSLEKQCSDGTGPTVAYDERSESSSANESCEPDSRPESTAAYDQETAASPQGSTSRAKPDYGVECQGLLCGYIELKAPGKGASPAQFRGHDRKQWENFKQLPNMLYSDGREFALYREGELAGMVRLEGLPDEQGGQAITDANAKDLAALLLDFLLWEPLVPETAKQLAQYLAPLCRMLRDEVVAALRNGSEAVGNVARDWQKYLFPGASDEEFADDYAQTVTFSFLLARSLGANTLDVLDAVRGLSMENLLLARAMHILTEQSVRDDLHTSLNMLQRVINKVPEGAMSGHRRDPWLHFYEDFLEKYDPELRKQQGVYYTPVEVVQAQVRLVNDLLQRRYNLPLGLAEGGVKVLDPAVGTGTYLLGAIEHSLAEVARIEGKAAQAARASLLGANLNGLEIMVAPYTMAKLRLSRMIRLYNGRPPSDGPPIILHNTLEAPDQQMPQLPQFYKPLGREHRRGQLLKQETAIIVVMGNPPYHRHDMATEENRTRTGGWIRFGETGTGKDAIFDDFTEPVRQAGKGGSLKNIYNHYVYFWRWALWKVFELPHDLGNYEKEIIGPGVVTYITASSYLEGDAFMGMRQHIRSLCDEVWILDLGGEGRGPRKDENVFAIQTPVAICIAARYGDPQRDKPAKVNYFRVEGSRAEKLSYLETCTNLTKLPFQVCPSDWLAPFTPERRGSYFDWPLLTDLMPWQWSGVQLKRKWPIAPDKGTLLKRWRTFMGSGDRARLFRETPGRKVTLPVKTMDGTVKLPPLAGLKRNAKAPKIEPFGYRSYDRQHLFVDNRLGDRLRKALWDVSSGRQVYLATIPTDIIGSGQAVTVSGQVPDLHYFSGRGAKGIFPLYRDQGAEHPNLHPGLADLLRESYGKPVAAEDVVAYLYAIMAHPGFTARFEEELSSRQLRVPMTADHDLFSEAVKIGRKLLFLQTFGERFAKGQKWPQGRIKCKKSVTEKPLPEGFSYDEVKQVLQVGDGEFGPVPPAVYDYEVSGLKVVQSWLGNRTGKGKGKKSSPLDDIQPVRWTAEFTSELLRLLNLLNTTLAQHGKQANLLDKILAAPLIKEDQLGPPPDETRKPLEQNGYQNGFWDEEAD